jgi:hypothetical protein
VNSKKKKRLDKYIVSSFWYGNVIGLTISVGEEVKARGAGGHFEKISVCCPRHSVATMS